MRQVIHRIFAAGLCGGLLFSAQWACAGGEHRPAARTLPGGGEILAEACDLDVGFIARLPRDCYFYFVDYPNGIPILRPGTEHQKRWPAYGETVTFEAHVSNKGSLASPPVNGRWKVNGVVLGTCVVPSIAPGQKATVTQNWTWNIAGLDTDHTDQTVTFEVDYDNQLAETFEQNNTLTDFLEGMSLAIYVEPQIYDAFNSRLNLVGTRSFEDWIQAQIRAMNDNFARSTYPLAPQGCLERVRIDKLVVSSPPPNDGLADGRWQFTGDAGYATSFADRVDNGLIHELMHQLGIIDLYVMPIIPTHNAVVTPDGLPCGLGFGFGRPGIMAGGDIAPHPSGQTQFMPQYCSYHDVMALNKNCGYKRGYYGEYMFDVPEYNYLVIKDSANNPAANVNVRLFQGGGGSLSATPIATGTTDASGLYQLPNRAPAALVTTATGHMTRPNPFGTINVVGGNATLLLELSRPGGDFDYRFLNIIDFNLAYWGGATEVWTREVPTHLAANSLPRVTTLNAALNAASVDLVWNDVPGATGYRVYRAGPNYNRPEDPLHEYENWVFQPIGTTVQPGYTDTTRFETCRYAVAPLAADGTEGVLSNRVFAPNLLNPWGVAVLPNQQRVILDPQNGFAYLRQTANGVYVANTGSEHNHNEYSRFVAIDPALNRMLTSHPGDAYGGPHSIRVTDVNGNTTGLFDIGTQGSGNGQFNTPAGVTVDRDSRIYAVDNGNARIQVFSASGGFLTAFGAYGTSAGKFRDPQGIAVGPDYRIYVCDLGNARVQVLQYTPGSNTVAAIGQFTGRLLRGATNVALAHDGSAFVTDTYTNRVEEFSPAGAWRASHPQALPPYSGNLVNPTGIAIDKAGQVIVCDTNNRRVVTVKIVRRAGDANCDGVVTWRDIDPLIAGLNDNSAGWRATFPDGAPLCTFENLDTNGDGRVTWRDIDPFIALLNQ